MRTSWLIVSTACMAALFAYGSARAADESKRHVPAASESMSTQERVEVWVVLSEPALATLPPEATQRRAALRQRILKQQDQVMAQLQALGAIESARVQQIRNAIAVKLPPAVIGRAKKINGVISVKVVSDRNRIGD